MWQSAKNYALLHTGCSRRHIIFKKFEDCFRYGSEVAVTVSDKFVMFFVLYLLRFTAFHRSTSTPRYRKIRQRELGIAEKSERP